MSGAQRGEHDHAVCEATVASEVDAKTNDGMPHPPAGAEGLSCGQGLDAGAAEPDAIEPGAAEPDAPNRGRPLSERPTHERSAEEQGVDGAGAGEARPGLEKTQPRVLGRAHLQSVVESLLFVADQALTAQHLAKSAGATTAEVNDVLEDLQRHYAARGIQLVAVGSGFQFRTAPANAPFVRSHVAAKPVRMTRPQMETLAIVAYRQPITRPEVDDVRGVDSGAALKILESRGLLRVLGRKEEPGRPLLYGTTTHFLEFFGLKRLRDLPTLREFGELSEESRALFAKKTGESILTQGVHAPPPVSTDEGADDEVTSHE